METRMLQNGDVEVRTFVAGTVNVEKRESNGATINHIVGYACVFDKWSDDLGWFKEKVDRNAYSEADMADVVALFNHDNNLLLARTASTLTLTVDDVGLRYEFDAPDTTAGRDLVTNIELGNVRGSSQRFIVKSDAWKYAQNDGELDERTILLFKKIIDVGPVVFPAYADTSVAKRSHDSGKTREAEQAKLKQIAVEAEARQRKLRLINF